jgi:hypothetical protein
MANEVNDMEDVISLIEGDLKKLLDEEEALLLDEKALLLLVYSELTDGKSADKTATALTTLYTTAFIEELIPELSAAVTTEQP